MDFESIIGLTASLIGIGTLVYQCLKKYQKKDLSTLFTELSDKGTTIKRQHRILYLVNLNLKSSGNAISKSYIDEFISGGRSKSAIFEDICKKNNIEPTKDLCIRVLGYDVPKFRNEWIANRIKSITDTKKQSKSDVESAEISPLTFNKIQESFQVVYISELLSSKYPETCKNLIDILDKHNIGYCFLEGTKDIWCRDYMPIQTPSGKLIQFKYAPSYLKDPKYTDTRSDVKHVDKVNGFTPIISDINLDGGNVVMYYNKAIITDRIFSENPDWSKGKLISELSKLLECEIIIIPAYKTEYDFTGHADGMMRFVDSNTVLVNNLDQDFAYMKKAIVKALDDASLRYINFPWFEHKIKSNNDHAIGIYLNYLEVGDLIVMPVFGVPGNKDAEALAKLKEVFPNKTIETINYNDVALAGGLLNCTTWVIRK